MPRPAFIQCNYTLHSCTVLLQAGRLPLISLSNASDNAAACIQPISHFEHEYTTWKTWPHTCGGSIFDLIMQIDFEGMCTSAIRECNTNTGESLHHRVSLRVYSGCRISIPLLISSKDFLSLSCSPPQNKRHSAEGFA